MQKCICSYIVCYEVLDLQYRKTKLRDIRCCIVQLVDVKERLLGLEFEILIFGSEMLAL